jgi:type I restriction enzyme S subunit
MQRRLDELCDLDPGAPLTRGNTYPFISMADVEAGLRTPSVSSTKAFAGSGARYQGGDTLLARITPCLENGKIAQVPKDVDVGFGSTEFVVLRAKSPMCDPDFLYYLARSDAVRRPAEKSMSGASGRQRVNRKAIAAIELDVPDLRDQSAIARLLSNLDELHATNSRRMRLAEASAGQIFEDWFIRFRFPGADAEHFVDSPIGAVPSTWELVPVSQAVQVNPTHKVDSSVLRPFVAMADVSEAVMVAEPSASRSTGSGAKFINGDTLLARITPCLENGKTAYVNFLADGEVGAGSTEFIVLRSARLPPEYVYLLARSDGFRSVAIKSMTGASGRQRVRAECFDSLLAAVPPTELATRFSDVVRPLFDLAYALHDQNRTLMRLRDWLSPRLIAGALVPGDLAMKI